MLLVQNRSRVQCYPCCHLQALLIEQWGGYVCRHSRLRTLEKALADAESAKAAGLRAAAARVAEVTADGERRTQHLLTHAAAADKRALDKAAAMESALQSYTARKEQLAAAVNAVQAALESATCKRDAGVPVATAAADSVPQMHQTRMTAATAAHGRLVDTLTLLLTLTSASAGECVERTADQFICLFYINRVFHKLNNCRMTAISAYEQCRCTKVSFDV